MKYHAAENLYVHQAIKPASLSAAETTGTHLDITPFSEVLVIASFGTAAANAEADLKIEESNSTTEASFGSITGGSFRQVTSTNDDAVYVGRFNAHKRKRYLRASNAGDAANAVLLSCTFVGISDQRRPVTQAQTVAFNL